MAGTTPNYAIPYPTGTDRVTDGDNAMEALARRVDTVMAAQIVKPNQAPIQVTPINGWTGYAQYQYRSGWVYLFIQLGKSTWGGSETMVNLPAEAWPPTHAYFGGIRRSDSVVIGLIISAASGALLTTQGGAGGIDGLISYPIR